MSCVIGYVDKDGKIFMGADSAAIYHTSLDIRNICNSKIFNKDDMLFGFVSSLRCGQILRYIFKIPSRPEGIDDMTYMCAIFVDAMKNCFKENDFALVVDGGELAFEGDILIGYRGALYKIESNFQIILEDAPYVSIGCGEPYATTSMSVLEDVSPDMTPDDKILLALGKCEHFNAGIRKPFYVYKMVDEDSEKSN
jgi:ATP-dependent protease HslVU (ClpYQ) peptidase subunit